MSAIDVGVGVALFNEQGQLLMELRSNNSTWGFLGGGLEFGESLADCAVREVFEESGLEIAHDFELIGVYSTPSETIVTYPERTVQKIDVFMKGRIIGGTLTLSSESLELRFFDLNALPSNLNIGARLPLQDLVQGIRNVLR